MIEQTSFEQEGLAPVRLRSQPGVSAWVTSHTEDAKEEDNKVKSEERTQSWYDATKVFAPFLVAGTTTHCDTCF